MTVVERPGSLCGRHYEREVLLGLLDGVRDGRGGVLVLLGEAGIGKTALLDHAAAAAADLPVVRVGVVPSGLTYAGLRQVCAPLLDLLEHLEVAHREALTTALGLTAGPVADRATVGLAVLGLLSHAAGEHPLVYLVDDAQGLDPESARVLAFVASRLPARAVLLLLAAREQIADLAALPSLAVEGLREADAEELLRLATPDDEVGGRIIAEARGNPAALLGLARGLSPVGDAGPPGGPTGHRVPDRRGDLPEETRRLLVVAAADPTRVLLETAGRLTRFDPWLARETYLDALAAAMSAGRRTHGVELAAVARAARGAPHAARPPSAPDLLLDGLTTTITEGHAAGAPVLRRAMAAVRRGELSGEEEIRWCSLVCQATHELWDEEAWRTLSGRYVQLARARGAPAVLPGVLAQRAGVHLLDGEFAAAAALVDETRASTGEAGDEPAVHAAMAMAAWRGSADEVARLVQASRGEVTGPAALLYNGLGRHADALAAAEQAAGHPLGAGFADQELVEAAVRTGAGRQATEAMHRLAACTTAGGTDWALGIQARSRALLSQGQAADRGYREAIERLARTRLRVELARAHLLYGEWLRRENRPAAARAHLGTAHETFTAVGAGAFAGRAGRELRAMGEAGELTSKEAQIALLARDGLSNREISGRLFISPRTVEWHLRNVFTKLDITSRRDLHLAAVRLQAR